MKSISDNFSRRSQPRTLVVLLPGVYDKPQDFFTYYFVHELRRRNLPVDIIAADSHLGYYNNGEITERLREDIIEPALSEGPRVVWLVGISLGGLGAMLYASIDARVQGVIALAPFLGTRQALAEVAQQGGWSGWQAEQSLAMRPWEQSLHSWIKAYLAEPKRGPHLLLGYGAQDRYAREQSVLAAQLPADNVLSLPGGHDWTTWQALFRGLLDHHDSKIWPTAAHSTR